MTRRVTTVLPCHRSEAAEAGGDERRRSFMQARHGAESGSILLAGMGRPTLVAELARRGLAITTQAACAAAAFVRDDMARPCCPVVVEVASPARAIDVLDTGAEDVVLATDPDSLVAARLAALVRRFRPGSLNVGDIAIDTIERSVMRDGRLLPLLPREYALFHLLARHVGTAVDHATVHRALWGRGFDPGTNVIAVHVSRLRAKLCDSGVVVVTERGKGYRLVVPVAASGERG